MYVYPTPLKFPMEMSRIAKEMNSDTRVHFYQHSSNSLNPQIINLYSINDSRKLHT